jgi:serine/threonine-protein kinase
VRCCQTCCAVYRSGFERCPTDGTALSAFSADPVVGTVINDLYEVEECVGEGAMGRVYRAHHLRLTQRQVALKILLGDLAATMAMRLRFTQEAQAASVLSHPNVVPVLDFGKTPQGLLFLAMEYVEGSSLARIILDEGPLDPARVVKLMRQLCLGLGHAHSHGLVHRDFKPDNVLVVDDPGGEIPRIADFGLAIFSDTDRDSARLTSAGTVVGTPLYTAPEQALDRGVDHRADLFALGVAMFEMLAGCPPFDDSSPVEVLHNNMAAPRPRIAQRAPGVMVPPALERIVLRLMSADREQRYQSAHAVIDALDQYERERRGELVALDDEETLPGIIARPRRGRAAVAVLGAGLAVAALAAMLWPVVSRPTRADGQGALTVVEPVAMAGVKVEASPAPVVAPLTEPPGEASAPAGGKPEGDSTAKRPAPARVLATRVPRARQPSANSTPGGQRARGTSVAAASPARPQDGADAQGAGINLAARPSPIGAAPAQGDRSDPPGNAAGADAAPAGDRTGSDTTRIARIARPALDEAAVAPPRPIRPTVDRRAMRAVIEAMTVEGSLSNAEVRRGIQRVAPRLAGCARSAAALTGAGASVRVSFTVDENGRARDVRSSGDSPQLAACVADAFGGLRTRVAPDVGDVRVALRVDFSPGEPR